jgi:hypothetical protein
MPYLIKSLEQNLGLYALDFDQELALRISGRPADKASASVDERQWGPGVPRNELVTQAALAASLQQSAGAVSQHRKNRVLSRAPEPIGRVTVVRLAAMDDSVNYRAIGVLNGLRDPVGGFNVIMPKQHNRADERFVFARQVCGFKKGVQLPVQGEFRQNAGARARV